MKSVYTFRGRPAAYRRGSALILFIAVYILSLTPALGQVTLSKSEFVLGEVMIATFAGALVPDTLTINAAGGERLFDRPITGPTGSEAFRYLLAEGDYSVGLASTGDEFAFSIVTEAELPRPTGKPITAMTLNIWEEAGHVEGGISGVVQAINAAQADLIALQECDAACPEILEGLRGHFGYERAEMEQRHNINLALISRYPITVLDTLRFLGTKVALPSGEMKVYVMHLRSREHGLFAMRDGASVEQILSSETQWRVPWVEMFINSANTVEPDLPTLLMGDLNSPSHLDFTPERSAQNWGYPPIEWPVTRLLEDAGFVDLYREAHPDPVVDLGFTWNVGQPIGTFTAQDVAGRIDYLMYRPRPQLTSSTSVTAYVMDRLTSAPVWWSDHRGVVAGFSNESALPVELTRFEAHVDGNTVGLTWTTATETNNAGFDVEVEGEVVTFVPGAGTTTQEQHYSYQATGLEPGRHRFRLRQVDFDGSVSYSDVVEATVEIPGGLFVSEVYPNPIEGQANVRIVPATSQALVIGLYDLLGRHVREVYQGRGEANVPITLKLDGRGLPSGTYFLRITSSTGRLHTQKIAVVASL